MGCGNEEPKMTPGRCRSRSTLLNERYRLQIHASSSSACNRASDDMGNLNQRASNKMSSSLRIRRAYDRLLLPNTFYHSGHASLKFAVSRRELSSQSDANSMEDHNGLEESQTEIPERKRITMCLRLEKLFEAKSHFSNRYLPTYVSFIAKLSRHELHELKLYFEGSLSDGMLEFSDQFEVLMEKERQG
ncbi:hypothetical protein Ahy_B07g088440 [Arachis hypogaea]|uniref:Uncharacterized protein n=1 Tax=Arachis hypogaea TaxID=3818 RepID=A0A444YEG2_ARAHY|nr:hypothetical protein Ahy_B07g088440 [Arachis hypogaea]